jgi:hypothetical protein
MAIRRRGILSVDTNGVRVAVKKFTDTRSYVKDLPMKISLDRQEENPSHEEAHPSPVPEI